MKLLVTAGALVIAASMSLEAQSTTAGPRAGAWAGEISLSAGVGELGAGVMRFRNDRSAWLFGLDGSVERNTQDGPGDVLDETETTTNLSGRIGMRTFRSPGSAVRPIVGAGLVGRYQETGSLATTWEGGVYGELGFARFFGESLALGMTSDLQLRYVDRDLVNVTETGVRLSFDLIRVSATIVF